MKRVGFLFEKIASSDNFRIAYVRARRGKQLREEVRRFGGDLAKNLSALQRALMAGPDSVSLGCYRFFTIFDPKERQICAPVFSERVLHHAVINLAGPYLDRYQIDDSYACLKKRGTYRALAKAQSQTRKHRYYLKLDVRKYFDSIDHEVLMGQLGSLFKDPKLLRLFERIIDSYHTVPGKGLPIGSLTSQYFANHYLGSLDHYLKEQLRIKAYCRYMDDFVLWHENKAQLKQWHRDIVDYLNNRLGLSLHPPNLNTCARGMTFLGYRVFPCALRLSQRSRQRFVSKFKTYEGFWKAGSWSDRKLINHMLPLLAFARQAETHCFRSQIISQYGIYP